LVSHILNMSNTLNRGHTIRTGFTDRAQNKIGLGLSSLKAFL